MNRDRTYSALLGSTVLAPPARRRYQRGRGDAVVTRIDIATRFQLPLAVLETDRCTLVVFVRLSLIDHCRNPIDPVANVAKGICYCYLDQIVDGEVSEQAPPSLQ